MDSVLFHPETSQRRALHPALGTYGRDRLSPGECKPLIANLLDLYRNNADSGIHGAAAWTLRQWGQLEKLKAIDGELMRLKDWGDRRWYVNNQGQTFAAIEGPVEFRMGSPPSEYGWLLADDSAHRRRIARRFALAVEEITVEQYWRFAEGNSRFQDAEGKFHRLFKTRYRDSYYSRPVDFVNWYGAAAYCNWLSQQEGIPRKEWCYVPSWKGTYSEGMRIPEDVLQKNGYRLPTEAEWEYACRAGTSTSRYYGDSDKLIGSYALVSRMLWCQSSGDRSNTYSRSPGESMPNDLGLFDMLGDVLEWVQDEFKVKKYPDTYIWEDELSSAQVVRNGIVRCLRGGYFGEPYTIRSAFHTGTNPDDKKLHCGFRPARTL